MHQELQARVTLRIADMVEGPWGLPAHDEVWVGRSAASGLLIQHEWIPRALCRFLPGPYGWVVQNGSRARVRMQNPYVDGAFFAPRALLALQEGQTLLSWPELDDYCQLGIVIAAEAASGLEALQNGRRREGAEPGTDYAAHHVQLSDSQRMTMAVMFAHLLTGEPAPANLAGTAAVKLGRSEQAIKNAATKVRDRVNEERWLNLTDSEQLGHYLIGTTRTITLGDLPRG